MTNYKETRRFTILNLELRKLSKSDLFFLLIFALENFAFLFFSDTFQNQKIIFTIFTVIIIWFLIFTTPFGLRFKNLYFSISWLFLSLLFLVNNYRIALVPLVAFGAYHFLRFVFYLKYDKEFIPFYLNRGRLERYVCKIEGRGGYKEDKTYMKILIFIGIIVILYGFSTIIDLKN